MIEVKQTITAADGTSYEFSATRRTVTFASDRSFCGCSKSEWKTILVVGWGRLGRHWHKQILPRHFELPAKTEYNYQPRSARHMRRKARLYGHQRPLEYTGEMKRKVMRVRDVRVLQSGKAAKVVLWGPAHLYAYRKDYGQPDKAEELRRISARDAQELARVMDETI